MFPIPFNFPFRKANGDISTIGAEINAGGGGSSYTLPTASAETKGGVKVGAGLTMDGEVLKNNNPTAYTLPTASAETKGGVKVGDGLTMDGEVLKNTNPTAYTLPTASGSTLGGVKVGTGLSINESGVLSASSSIPPTGTNASEFTVSTLSVGQLALVTLYLDPSASTDGTIKISRTGASTSNVTIHVGQVATMILKAGDSITYNSGGTVKCTIVNF